MLYIIIFSAFLPIVISATIFIVSLVRFCKAEGQPELQAKRKVPLIVSIVLLGVVFLAYIGIAILLSYAIRNM